MRPPEPREPRATRDRELGLVRGVVAERVVISAPADPFLDLRALADYSSLSVRKLRDLLDDPSQPIPAYRVGGKILVRRGEFDSWIASYRRDRTSSADRLVDEVLQGLAR